MDPLAVDERLIFEEGMVGLHGIVLRVWVCRCLRIETKLVFLLESRWWWGVGKKLVVIK
jgi:hypothetical protein